MKLKHKLAYMETAEAFAKCSVSKRLQVGAVIVKNNRIISCGYNALPEHLDGPLEDSGGHTKPEVRHAEKNALMGLMKGAESSVGSMIFCTHACCLACAIDMVDAGVLRYYFKDVYRCSKGLEYLIENGVKVCQLEGGKFREMFQHTLQRGLLND